MSSSTFIADAALQRDEREWREKCDKKFEVLDSKLRTLQPSACPACFAMLISPTSLTYFAECSKWPDFSPAQPRRAKTRRSTRKAAGESKPEEVPTTLRGAIRAYKWILANGKAPPVFPISKWRFLKTLRISTNRERSWRTFSASC